jgi:hypothetical protein
MIMFGRKKSSNEIENIVRTALSTGSIPMGHYTKVSEAAEKSAEDKRHYDNLQDAIDNDLVQVLMPRR